MDENNMINLNSEIEKLAYEWVKAEASEVSIDGNYYYQTQDLFQTRLNKLISTLLANGNFSEEDIYLLSAIVGEIGNNSFDHNLGNWPDISGIFFGHEIKGKEVKIVLADRGQGVMATLKKAVPAIKNHADALRIAFTEKISGRTTENRGNGLKFVKEGVKNKGMHLAFISGNAQADLNEQMQIKEISKNIRGCLAILSLQTLRTL